MNSTLLTKLHEQIRKVEWELDHVHDIDVLLELEHELVQLHDRLDALYESEVI